MIPVLLYRDGMLVKGRGFDSWRTIGAALPAVRLYEMRQVDELVFLDIGATPNGKGPDFAQVEVLAEQCFMPLAVGGGVRAVEDIRRLLAVGADKVVVNTHAEPAFVSEAAAKFGSQCIAVSIDARGAEVASRCGTVATGRAPVAWAKALAEAGAGEILLGSVERDGAMGGYDLGLLQAVSAAVDVPVVPVSGAGSYAHMVEAIEAGAHGVGAGAMFCFTDQTPKGAAEYLKARGVEVRL